MRRSEISRLLRAHTSAFGVVLFGGAAHAQAIDTSEWVCEFCPFENGHRADYEIGATSVGQDSAYFGDASGYEEDGVYANLDGEGQFSGDAYFMRWRVEDLGLDSRRVAADGGRPGVFEYEVSYRELPRRQFNTTSTVFRPSGGALSLPSGWVRAPVTSGFSTLATSLLDHSIESDRNVVTIGGRFFAADRWRFSADYRRQEQDGSRIYGGSYFTNAALLPAEIDYVTDSVELGVRYATDRWVVSLDWYLSDFENAQTGFTWEHPFTTVPGGEVTALAQPPDSRFQQLSLSASVSWPTANTHASVSAALGQIEQDELFLPYTNNAMLATTPLPRNNLDGDVDTTRLGFAITAKPFDKSRVKLTYRYDERDNHTSQEIYNRVIADSFVSGELETSIPYSYERSSLRIRGDYDLFYPLRVSAGYERKETDRDFQEVAEQNEDTGWGRFRWRPLQTVELELRGGASKRDIDRYNEVFAATLGQNPLMRKYHLAYRYREFGELSLSYSPSAVPLSVTFNALYADDSYTQSRLGMIAADELHYGADLNWNTTDNVSVYLGLGMEDIESEQLGSATSGPADWRATHDDDFTTIGAGLRVRNIGDRINLQLDYTQVDGGSRIVVDSDSAASSVFPELETELYYLRLKLSYRRSERLTISLNLNYQQFVAPDWALAGVQPASVPTVLSLGARPYDDDVLAVGLGFRFGTDRSR